LSRKSIVLFAALASALVVAATASAAGGRAGSTGVVYVTSQGLYYDTFVTNDPLPMEGKFQLLETERLNSAQATPAISVAAGGRT
jgi:hypothetical protein